MAGGNILIGRLDYVQIYYQCEAAGGPCSVLISRHCELAKKVTVGSSALTHSTIINLWSHLPNTVAGARRRTRPASPHQQHPLPLVALSRVRLSRQWSRLFRRLFGLGLSYDRKLGLSCDRKLPHAYSSSSGGQASQPLFMEGIKGDQYPQRYHPFAQMAVILAVRAL